MTSDAYLSPDFSAAALLTIDTQRDVLDGGSIEIAGTSQALPQMQVLVEAFRSAQRPIVHVVRLYRPDGENVDLCRRSLIEGGAMIVAPGARGAELAPELLPDDCSALDSGLLLSGGIQPLGPREAVSLQAAVERLLQHPTRSPPSGPRRLDARLRRLQLPQLPACVDLRRELSRLPARPRRRRGLRPVRARPHGAREHRRLLRSDGIVEAVRDGL